MIYRQLNKTCFTKHIFNTLGEGSESETFSVGRNLFCGKKTFAVPEYTNFWNFFINPSLSAKKIQSESELMPVRASFRLFRPL